MQHRDKKWTGRLRQKWNNDVQDVKVDDLVLNINENSPRGTWPMGIVIYTHQLEEKAYRLSCQKC